MLIHHFGEANYNKLSALCPVLQPALGDYFGLVATPSRRQSIVVVQRDSVRAGLAVGVLFGATQTVIKPLPPVFREVPGVSGSAILGNGRVALILDIQALLQDFRMQEARLSQD